ncbi:MAG: T9SS type A sorting domain-containing protein, partial [Bacteroidota bacterium]|nr:T9SS type A sorting domain-containing protein [Bacteroidota bacterium]
QTVGIVDQTGMEVLIYPNPAQEHFMIEVVGSNKDENYELKIIDSRGRIVHENQFKKSAYFSKSKLITGIYYVLISSNESIFRQKLVINE